MLSLFYSKKKLQDTLIINFNDLEITNVEEHKTHIILKNNDTIIGINIFNFSNFLSLKSGALKPSANLVDTVKKITKIHITENIQPGIVIGQILELKKIENSSAQLCKVKIDNNKVIDIVCGATNIKALDKVVVAKIGSLLPNGLRIKKSVVYNNTSYGMICSKKELNLKDETKKQVWILASSSKVGSPFWRHCVN